MEHVYGECVVSLKEVVAQSYVEVEFITNE